MLQDHEVTKYIYLVLSGNVELLNPDTELVNILYAGSILGEMSGIYKHQSTTTYRAVSYVKALRIPCNLYLEFINQNDMYTMLENFQEQRSFMRNSWLFGEGISYATQNNIAMVMESVTIGIGEEICQKSKTHLSFLLSQVLLRELLVIQFWRPLLPIMFLVKNCFCLVFQDSSGCVTPYITE